MPKPDVEITVQQAAEIAGVDVRTIRRWIDAGYLVARKIGRGETHPYLISLQSLKTYLAEVGRSARER